MSGDNCDMREFMYLVEAYASVGIMTEKVEDEAPQEEAKDHPVLADLRDLVFKLRSHMDEQLEPGFERAAEMIENLIRKHTEGTKEN